MAGGLRRHVKGEAQSELVAVDIGAFDRAAMDLVVFLPLLALLLDGVLAAADGHRPFHRFVADDVVGIVLRCGSFAIAPLEQFREIFGNIGDGHDFLPVQAPCSDGLKVGRSLPAAHRRPAGS
ncbi:hypothetical protein MPLB_1510236 [Mesorhizobium sp. ORS 3324]|nr:hypothetical protein MPLB_1510236 [Mesorhizobium sp. ORS 3324]